MASKQSSFFKINTGDLLFFDGSGLRSIPMPNFQIPTMEVLEINGQRLSRDQLSPGDIVIIAYNDGDNISPGYRIDVIGPSKDHRGCPEIIKQDPHRREREILNSDFIVGLGWYVKGTAMTGEIARIYHIKLGVPKKR